MTDKYIIVVRKDFKGKITSKRKDFMDLLLKALSDNSSSATDLSDRFGTKVIGKYNSGNSITVLNDGEVMHKE